MQRYAARKDTQGMENIMRITLIAAVLALTGFCLPLAANAEEKVMSVECIVPLKIARRSKRN